jgi:hypothetical protein
MKSFLTNPSLHLYFNHVLCRIFQTLADPTQAVIVPHLCIFKRREIHACIGRAWSTIKILPNYVLKERGRSSFNS